MGEGLLCSRSQPAGGRRVLVGKWRLRQPGDSPGGLRSRALLPRAGDGVPRIEGRGCAVSGDPSGDVQRHVGDLRFVGGRRGPCRVLAGGRGQPLQRGVGRGEEWGGVGRALAAGADAARRDNPEFAVAAFVEERDLVTARRIVRLLGMTIEVGRVDRMPEGIAPAAQGEILMGARRGILQVRIPLGSGLSSNQIRDRVAAVLGLLEPREPAPTSSSPVRMERSEGGGKALVTRVDQAVALEAGPVPIPDVYDQIDREVRSLLQESGASAAALEVLGELARLRGAGAAKARAFLALDQALPQPRPAAVKGIAPEVERQAGTDEGFYYLTVSDPSASKRILLQRSFLDGSSLSHFDLIVDLQQGQSSVFWVGQPPEEPAGTQAVATAAVFFHESESCRGLRLIGG